MTEVRNADDLIPLEMTAFRNADDHVLLKMTEVGENLRLLNRRPGPSAVFYHSENTARLEAP